MDTGRARRVKVTWDMLSSTADRIIAATSSTSGARAVDRGGSLPGTQASHGILSNLRDQEEEPSQSDVPDVMLTTQQVDSVAHRPTEPSAPRRANQPKLKERPTHTQTHTQHSLSPIRHVPQPGSGATGQSSREELSIVSGDAGRRRTMPSPIGAQQPKRTSRAVPAEALCSPPVPSTPSMAPAGRADDSYRQSSVIELHQSDRGTAQAGFTPASSSAAAAAAPRAGVLQVTGVNMAAAHRSSGSPAPTSSRARQSNPAERPTSTGEKLFGNSSKQIKHYELKLRSLLERSMTVRTLPAILDASKHLKSGCCSALRIDTRRALKQGYDRMLWHEGCHRVIEALRFMPQSASADADHKHQLLAFIDESSAVLRDLLDELQEGADVTLPKIMDSERARLPVSGKAKVLAIICHHCYKWLGDLSRYTQQAQQSNNWSESWLYYIRAVQLAPRTGRPYNQLAIIAMCARRKLDAVFYYSRSLAIKTPIVSAKEALLGLYDDIAKKTLLLERHQDKLASDKQKKEDKKMVRKKRVPRNTPKPREPMDDDDSALKEIWIHPLSAGQSASSKVSGIGSEKPSPDLPAFLNSSENEVATLRPPSSVQRGLSVDSVRRLKKHVVLRFLRLHGMLFTKIGMEHFRRVCSAFQHDLEQLVFCYKDDSLMFAKMMTINVFALNHILSAAPASESFVPLCKEAAQLFNLLVTALLAACVEQVAAVPANAAAARISLATALGSDGAVREAEQQDLVDSVASEDPPAWHAEVGLDKLSVLLPAVCIGLACMKTEMSGRVDGFPWHGMASLLNGIVEWPVAHCLDTYTGSGDECLIVPPEDDLLNGFLPLLESLGSVAPYRASTEDAVTDQLHFAVRWQRLVSLAEGMAGEFPSDGCRSHLMLTMDAEGVRSFAVQCTSETPSDSTELGGESKLGTSSSLADPLADSPEKDSGDEDEQDEDDIVILDELSCESDERSDAEKQFVDETEEDDAIRQLKARRAELQMQIDVDDDYRRTVEELMAEQAALPTIHMTVRPRYLVIDTNCLISNLRELQQLTETGHFTFIIPLIVLNELDGLKRRISKVAEKGEQVEVAAKEAIAFLEEKFSGRHRAFRAMTNQGSLLNTIAFRKETGGVAMIDGNNDDIVLRCAMVLCKEQKTEVDPETNVIGMERAVVLLTNDAGLQVKAHVEYMPTRSVKSFVHWYEKGAKTA